MASFTADSNLPSPSGAEGPFVSYGIRAVGNNLYITYFAPHAPLSPTGTGAGILDVCNLNTSSTAPICKRLAASNLDGSETAPTLNSAYGLAVAPKHFGELSGALLVGNLNDGMIHGFDRKTGALIGTLNLSSAITGLRSLQFGRGSMANLLFFTAGPSP